MTARLPLLAAAALALLAALGVSSAQEAEGPKPQEQPPAEAPEPGFLGVSMEPFTPEGATAAAIRVTAVVPGSAAETAGLAGGDLILAVNGQPFEEPAGEVLAAFGEAIRGAGVGGHVSLTIRRQTTTSRTYVDEEPLGPAEDGVGPDGAAEVLPDLAKLLEEHPDRLVGVRARTYEREKTVEVVLGRRPQARTTPLPPNGSLRPDLEARPLEPEAALAQAAIARAQVEGSPLAERFAELTRRLNEDEKLDDPFRLRTVRYLHRDPLRLPGATRGLARSLSAVLGAPGAKPALETLIATARVHLDAPAPAEGAPSARPKPGSMPAEHARFLTGCVIAAEAAVGQALSPLTDDERTELSQLLPPLAETFTEQIYLHTDEDRQRRRGHLRAVALLAKVDRGALLGGLAALIPLTDPAYLDQLRVDLSAAQAAGAAGTASGVRGSVIYAQPDCVIGSSGYNRYLGGDYRVVVDLGGDDVYQAPVGAGRPGRPAAVCLDLGGDDRYMANVPYAQGAGFMGVGLLVDTSGDDAYTSNAPFAQGAAAAGAGLLLDLAGNDTYRGTAYAQGAVLTQGLAALVDADGDDLHTAGVYAQGFAGPGGFGCLLARGGDDRYVALGREPGSYGDPGIFRGMSQGAAVGFRTLASGGIAALVDDGGRDRYEAGNFSQGGGYYFGWGLLADLGKDPDRYEGARYAQAFAAHSALGSLWDQGGDDVYRGWVGAQASASWDLTVTAFLEDGGNDRYHTGPGFSVGASAHNGFSLFVDRAGIDRYRVAPGRAGPNDYHGGPSVSVFVDAGGEPDTYAGGGLADGQAGTHAEAAVVLDLDGALDPADEAALERLLPSGAPPAPPAKPADGE